MKKPPNGITMQSIDIESNGKKALQALADCYQALGDTDAADKYQHEADIWRLPDLD